MQLNRCLRPGTGKQRHSGKHSATRETMTTHASDLSLIFDPTPAELRATLAAGINAFHATTVPQDSTRFGFSLRDSAGTLAGGVVGLLSWQWLFVEALFVTETWRGQGLGRRLLAAAETHAQAQGCHSVWLDTFQARDFYLGLGYEMFGELQNYPGPQSRAFLRKTLGDKTCHPSRHEHPRP